MESIRTGYSYYEFVGDGVTDVFPVNFVLGTLQSGFVTCQVDNEVDGLGHPVYRELVFTPGESGIVKVLGPVAADGAPVVFRRVVPKDALLHLYANGSILDYPSLDETHLQLMMAIQELLDGFGLANIYTHINMHGFNIVGVNADSTNPTSVVTFEKLREFSADVQALVTLGTPDGASLIGYNTGSVKDYLDALAASGGSALVGFQQAGTGASARTVQSKISEFISVKDFGAVGDNTADDTDAINAAVTLAAIAGGKVFFPAGQYKTSAQITVPAGVTLYGEGAADTGGASVIVGSHLYGPVVRITGGHSGMCDMAVSASSARSSAAIVEGATYAGLGRTRDEQNFGVWVEAVDSSGAIADDVLLYNVWAYGQPAAGIVLIGATYGSVVEKCGVNNNYTNGHGFVIDNGYYTDRTNKAVSGVLSVVDCQAYKMGGHALIVGSPVNLGTPPIRVLVDNFDCYNAATTGARRFVDFVIFFYSDNSHISYSAVNGALDTLGGVFVAGRNNQLVNNRYLATAQPVKIQPTGADSRATGGIDVIGLYTTQATALVHTHAVLVDAACTGVRVYAGAVDANFTDVANDAAVERQKLTERLWKGTLKLDGLAFPATQVPSADANTLDDYEEGTWTPTFSPSSGAFGAITYDLQAGRYTKIGNVVTVWAQLGTSAVTVGTASGTIKIAGLPFAHGATMGSAGVVGYAAGFSTNNPADVFYSASLSLVDVYYRATANGASTALPVSSIATGAASNRLYFTLTYRV